MASSTKGRAFLFLEAGRRVYRCQFSKNLTTIGGDRRSDIVLRDREIEPDHAQITRAGEAYTLRAIEDAEVRVDGEPVVGGWELYNGDRIQIGDTDILFCREQPEAPSTVHLVIRKPGEPPMGFWTAKSTIVIGREKGDIIIDDPLLSKVHAILENFCAHGQFLLDARSERGTGLNGESIEARTRIVDGDLITVGDTEIEFRSQPYASETGADAARLAQERVRALRNQGGFPKVGSEIAAAPAEAPRNPYQRYPSQLPDVAPTRAAQPKSPPPSRPTSHGRGRGRLDLRSGIQTGIGRRAKSGPISPRPAPAAPRPGPRLSPPPERHAPRPAPPVRPTGPRRGSQGPAPLPNFQPRRGWGDPEKQGRGFGERAHEMDTRLSLGDVKKDGLWYLPDGAAQGGPRRPAPKPIIRARGDKLPPMPSAPAPRPATPRPPDQRARIQRRDAPDQGPPMPPMRARLDVAAPPRPMAPPPARPRPSPPSSDPGHRPVADAPAVPGIGAPAARPGDGERWYIPDEVKNKKVRSRRSEAAWYLPGGSKKRRPDGDDFADEYGDRHERPDPEKSSSHLTQVFNPDDY